MDAKDPSALEPGLVWEARRPFPESGGDPFLAPDGFLYSRIPGAWPRARGALRTAYWSIDLLVARPLQP